MTRVPAIALLNHIRGKRATRHTTPPQEGASDGEHERSRHTKYASQNKMSGYTHDKALGVRFHQDQSEQKPSTKKKGLWKRRLTEFCKRTDLHGFKYIVMEDLTRMERGFWALAVVISIVFAAYFVVTACRWYARNPIITVIESTQGAIWDIPFPAVTICDLNAVSKRRARAFANNVTLPTNMTAEGVFEALQFAPLIHSVYVSTVQQKQQLEQLQRVLDLNKLSLTALFTALSPAASCTQMLQRCMWKNTIYHCEELFQRILTMYKFCCTFNYYALPLDLNSRNEHVMQHSEPRRVASCGYQTALTVLMQTDPEDYYSALLPSQGALVFIDSAYNIPNQESPSRLVNPSTEVLIALSPERTYTTTDIRSYAPEQRQCYYSDEVKLGEFRQYSLHNCIATQRIQVIKSICDCVPYYFPNKEYYRVCNFNDMECLENTLRPRDKLLNSGAMTPTPCLPECEHYDYPVEVAKGNLATDMKLSGLPFFNNVDLSNCSLLNVFFNDLVSTRFRRDVYLNWQNFTAAFGGLLSLMLGFTLIAFFDLIIFFTIRLAYDNKYPSKNKKTPKLVNENEKKINNWMENSVYIQQLNGKDFGIRKSTKKFKRLNPSNTHNIASKY